MNEEAGTEGLDSVEASRYWLRMSLRPLADRILIEREKREEKTPGGIFIPETVDDKRAALLGTVIATGPGKLLDNGRLIEPSVKIGDKVLYGKYSGTALEVGGQKLLVVREDDILGVVE